MLFFFYCIVLLGSMSWAPVYGNLVAWNALKSEMFSGWMTGLLFLPSLFILSYFASHEALHHPKCTVGAH